MNADSTKVDQELLNKMFCIVDPGKVVVLESTQPLTEKIAHVVREALLLTSKETGVKFVLLPYGLKPHVIAGDMDLEKARAVFSSITGAYCISPNADSNDFCVDGSFLTVEQLESIAYLARYAPTEMESIERS